MLERHLVSHEHLELAFRSQPSSRAASVHVKRASLLAACVFLCASLPARGADEVPRPAEPRLDSNGDELAQSGAPRVLARVMEAGPAPRALTLLLGTGYGYTEGLLGVGDRHDRVLGNVGLDVRALTWMSIGVLFSGRYDHHVVPGQTADAGLMGLPSLRLRADHRVSRSLAVNAYGELEMPGADAPSLVLGAITPSLSVAATYSSRALPLSISGNLGYRLDRSSHAAPEPQQLSPSDRLAIGVSSFDSLLVGLAARMSLGRLEARAEARWDILVGSGRPTVRQSPLILGAGLRWAVNANVALESMLELCASERPDLTREASWIPVPPRYAALFGLSYRWEAEVPKKAASLPVSPERNPAATTASTKAKEAGRILRGHVVGEGVGPLGDAQVTLEMGSSPVITVPVDSAGRFEAPLPEAVEPPLEITIEAAGYEPLHRRLETLSDIQALVMELPLTRRRPGGEIQGNIRSVRGIAVQADVEILPEGSTSSEARHLRAAGGRFAVEVEPGTYAVVVVAAGYEQQKRRIVVESDGVTLLNVELKGRK